MSGVFKEWDARIAARHDPAIRYGTYILSGSEGPTAVGAGGGVGGASEGMHGVGAARGNPSQGGEANGDFASNYGGNASSSNAAANDPLGDIFQGLADAEVRAAGIMAEAQRQAAAEIRAGMEAAAQATIESAKIAAAAVLEQANIADARVREFWDVARADLKPIIDQGRFAADEYASMMGIANADGTVVPFDQSDLEETPGYQWDFNQAQRALQNSAQGTALSGANTLNTIGMAQQLSSQAFQNRLDGLGFLAQGGWNAARDQANAATQTGSTYADIHTTAGSNLADIYSQQGSDLSRSYITGSQGIANTAMAGAESRVGLITGLATAGANLRMSQMLANQRSQDSKRSGIMGLIGTGVGAFFGGPAGAAIGGSIGGQLG